MGTILVCKPQKYARLYTLKCARNCGIKVNNGSLGHGMPALPTVHAHEGDAEQGRHALLANTELVSDALKVVWCHKEAYNTRRLADKAFG